MADSAILNKEAVAMAVAVGAIKFTILRSAAGKDIIFDFEKSISFEGDSGPYLQYTHARILSVIEKAHALGIRDNYEKTPEKPYAIEHTLYQFPEVALRASNEREPHHVVTYLLSLASEFNSFYAIERIADSFDTLAPYKLALARAVALTLKNGLHSLGIAAPEQM
jgi:arginyl-tRNA synthetase